MYHVPIIIDNLLLVMISKFNHFPVCSIIRWQIIFVFDFQDSVLKLKIVWVIHFY